MYASWLVPVYMGGYPYSLRLIITLFSRSAEKHCVLWLCICPSSTTDTKIVLSCAFLRRCKCGNFWGRSSESEPCPLFFHASCNPTSSCHLWPSRPRPWYQLWWFTHAWETILYPGPRCVWGYKESSGMCRWFIILLKQIAVLCLA